MKSRGEGKDRSFGKVEKVGKFEEIKAKKGNFGARWARGEIFWAKVNRERECAEYFGLN
jgi:hypothetical protein